MQFLIFSLNVKENETDLSSFPVRHNCFASGDKSTWLQMWGQPCYGLGNQKFKRKIIYVTKFN